MKSLNNADDSTVTLFCESGTLNNIEIFGKSLHDSTCEEKGAFLEVDSGCSFGTEIGDDVFDVTDRTAIETKFKDNCKGEITCDLVMSTLTPTVFAACPKNSEYYMRTSCKSDKIFGVEKSQIAIVVVILDLVIVLFVYFMF